MIKKKLNRLSFSKKERLKSRKRIDFLIKKGQRITEFPLTGIWAEHKIDSNLPVQLAISIPKKKIKKAVKRNLLKRRIREIYRKNKPEFYQFLNDRGKSIIILLVYHSEVIFKYADLEKPLKEILKKIMRDNA